MRVPHTELWAHLSTLQVRVLSEFSDRSYKTWWSCVFSASSGSSVQSLQVDSKYVCFEGEMNKDQAFLYTADGHTDFTCIYSYFPLNHQPVLVVVIW